MAVQPIKGPGNIKSIQQFLKIHLCGLNSWLRRRHRLGLQAAGQSGCQNNKNHHVFHFELQNHLHNISCIAGLLAPSQAPARPRPCSAGRFGLCAAVFDPPRPPNDPDLARSRAGRNRYTTGGQWRHAVTLLTGPARRKQTAATPLALPSQLGQPFHQSAKRDLCAKNRRELCSIWN